ncbi:hypothetical protein JCM18899A_31760 [Nocardioides sp. AN3]
MVTDETYKPLVYSGLDTRSLPEVCPEFTHPTVVVSGVAKPFARMAVGLDDRPGGSHRSATNLQSHTTSNVAHVPQRAPLAGLTRELTAATQMQTALRRRRRRIGPMLDDGRIECVRDAGRTRQRPSVRQATSRPRARRRLIATSPELAEHILDPARVAVVPAQAFGSPRIAAILPMPRVMLALSRALADFSGCRSAHVLSGMSAATGTG